jgi:hypothetical protein
MEGETAGLGYATRRMHAAVVGVHGGVTGQLRAGMGYYVNRRIGPDDRAEVIVDDVLGGLLASIDLTPRAVVLGCFFLRSFLTARSL